MHARSVSLIDASLDACQHVAHCRHHRSPLSRRDVNTLWDLAPQPPRGPAPGPGSGAGAGVGHNAFTVVGHCCETGDLLTPAPGDPEVPVTRDLGPVAPQVGDLLVVEGAGAYCSSMSAKNYNSFPEAAEAMLLDDVERGACAGGAGRAEGDCDSVPPRCMVLIRRRQTFDQMVQNEVALDLEALAPRAE